MKPLPIADYLESSRARASQKASPRREASPFRPRSLSEPAERQSRVRFPPSTRAAEAGGVGEPAGGRTAPARFIRSKASSA